MAVTRIWDADNGVWQLVGGTVGAEASGAGLYLPIAGGQMTGPLLLATNPTVPEQAATKAYVDSMGGGGGGAVLPTGAIVAFGGPTPPTGFLACDGAEHLRSLYPTLFGVIGVAYGAGDGSTTFKVPDLRGRFPLGKAASGTGSALGAVGGALNHVHGGPSHTHSGPSHSHAQVAHVHDLGTNPASGGGYGTTAAGGHDHTVPSQSTSSDSHAHTFSDSDSFGTGSPSNAVSNLAGGGSAAAGGLTHTHSGSVSVSGTTSSDAHSHTRAAINTDAVGNHSHTIGAHVHDLGNSTSGGATTTGTGGTGNTGAAGTGDTDAANPPFQTVEYIIKT